MNKTYNTLYSHIKGLETIDTHEHLPYKESAREKDTDVLKEYLTHYFNRDLVSAGLGPEDYQKVLNHKLPIRERWKIVEPYWEAARYTGYGRSLDISVKALYGINGISGKTIEKLNQKFLKTLRPGHFRKVLKDVCNIKVSLLSKSEFDHCLGYDRTLFRAVYAPDIFINPKTGVDVMQVERYSGIRISSMNDWLEACIRTIEKFLAASIPVLKCGLAYHRTLKFDRVSKNDAEEGFRNIFTSKHTPDWGNQVFVVGKAFQDYMMHFILDIAKKKRLTYQFHTGLQEGNGNYISNSDPALLTNLFLEYPDVDFDLFHIGYPYQQTLSALAKNFPNVYIDMCWAHIISPEASVRALSEYLDAVPYNKISAFGADYCFVDAVVGHLTLARQNVAKALAQKVDEGVYGINKAKEIAEMLFYKNPYRIMKLDGRI
jgi:hypothetical protein